jgi:hypothetical protein
VGSLDFLQTEQVNHATGRNFAADIAPQDW